jgi:ParB family chromosome partitioning protein
MSSGNEWYTPSTIIMAVREVLGQIDLDPASCEAANAYVGARQYYTKEQNGLSLPWSIHGKPSRLWLNPPYGRTSQGRGSNLKSFTTKLLSEFACGNISQAILLIPTNTATTWFTPLWNHDICFPQRRIRFLEPSGRVGTGMSFPTCFVYLGNQAERFRTVFQRFGHVVSPARQYPRAVELWSQPIITEETA